MGIDVIGRIRRDPALRARLEQLSRADQGLTRLLYAKPRDVREVADWQRKLDSARADRDRLSRSLLQDSKAWSAGRVRLRAGLDQIRAALAPDQVVVDYMRWRANQGPQYVAFVIAKQGPVQRIGLGSAAEVEAAVERYRDLVAHPPQTEAAEQETHAAAVALHARIWQPLAKAVGAAKLVYVVPDGPLATVPFAALPGTDPQRTLYDDRALCYLAQVQDLLPWPDRRPPGAGALALGGIDYDRALNERPQGFEDLAAREITLAERIEKAPAGMQFPPLAGTLNEAHACLGYYTSATRDRGWLLEGPYATEHHLRLFARGRRLLHLATHGFVRLDLADETAQGSELDPLLLTGLALAGCNLSAGGGDDDGILTALEAAQLDLDGVQLVILSACETARGTALAGEAVLGLTSSFREAGAERVLSSLWPVSDQATVLLMELFYRAALGERLPPALALRRAALALRDLEFEHEGERVRPFQAPALWAPFVAYGPVD